MSDSSHAQVLKILRALAEKRYPDIPVTRLESGRSLNAPSGPPKKPGRVERRAAPRVLGQVTFISSEIQGGGQVLNMSAGGALISSSPPHPSVGSEIELYFGQPEMQEPLYAVAKVVHQTGSMFAVRFLPIQPEVRKVLSSLVRKKKKGKAPNRR